MLHLVKKQAYKLELPKNWKIHDIFHVTLLEQDTTRKDWVDNENNAVELDVHNKSKEYKMEAIQDSAIYVKESKSGHLPDLYYLVS